MTLALDQMVEQERAVYEQRQGPTLVTVDGFTREQAFENYMRALSEFVVYLFQGFGIELLSRPAWAAYLSVHHRVPTDEARQVVVGFQVQEHVRLNPPRFRTIELVSG